MAASLAGVASAWAAWLPTLTPTALPGKLNTYRINKWGKEKQKETHRVFPQYHLTTNKKDWILRWSPYGKLRQGVCSLHQTRNTLKRIYKHIFKKHQLNTFRNNDITNKQIRVQKAKTNEPWCKLRSNSVVPLTSTREYILTRLLNNTSIHLHIILCKFITTININQSINQKKSTHTHIYSQKNKCIFIYYNKNTYKEM